MKSLFCGLAFLAALAAPAVAQVPSPCAPYDVVAAALGEKYHEVPVARMLSDRGFAIEVLAAPDGSSFTILGISAADGGGKACILATGSAFSVLTDAAAPGKAL